MAASLAGLVVATIPARGGAARLAGVLRAQGATPVVTIRRPTHGALGGVPTVPATHVGILRQATKASHAIPVVAGARRPRPATNAQAVASMATGVRRAHVGQPAATIGPSVRQATRSANGPTAVVPVGMATTNGAAAEVARPQVLAAKLPQVPSAGVPAGPGRARRLPATPMVRSPEGSVAITAGLESSTGPSQLPAPRAEGTASARPRRQALQTDATAGCKLLKASPVDVVPQAEDATPRLPIAATPVAFPIATAHLSMFLTASPIGPAVKKPTFDSKGQL